MKVGNRDFTLQLVKIITYKFVFVKSRGELKEIAGRGGGTPGYFFRRATDDVNIGGYADEIQGGVTPANTNKREGRYQRL